MPVRNASDLEYSAWVDSIGQGVQEEEQSLTEVTLDLIEQVESLEEIIDFLFPHTILNEYEEVSKQAFLSPLNIYVDEFNSLLL